MIKSPVFDINGTLLRHIGTGGWSSQELRFRCPQLTAQLEEFFAARTDVARLRSAQIVSRTLLASNDMDDLNRLRHIVANQELRRKIKYEKQRDHTAHTVYLFLLGVWLFDNLPLIRNALRNTTKPRDDTSLVSDFLLRWKYASLLHDVGYVFQELSDETKQDRKSIDEMLKWTWLDRLTNDCSQKTRAELRRIHRRWRRLYGDSFERNFPPTAQAEATSQGCLSILRRVSQAPWARDLKAEWANKNIFQLFDPNSGPVSPLRQFAERIAKKGYGRNGDPCVDHAVASGLLLFQYCSYWRWLVEKLRRHKSAFEELAGEFHYGDDTLENLTLPSCRSVAYHNVANDWRISQPLLQKIRLRTEPITFLGVLCDELQRWDRFPAGEQDFMKYARDNLESKDIELFCETYSESRGRAIFFIHRPGFKPYNSFKAMRQLRDFCDVVDVLSGKPRGQRRSLCGDWQIDQILGNHP